MELEFRRPLLHEVLIHAGACYVILSCSGQKINGVDIMSYHYSDVTKISDLEELAYDLQADHCLLLMAFVISRKNYKIKTACCLRRSFFYVCFRFQ